MSLVEDEDGFFKIRKISEQGDSYWEGIDKSDVVELKKHGVITKVYRDSDGNTYSSQVQEEDASMLKEVKTHIITVQKDQDMEDLRQRIKELEAPGEQARKDEASLKLQKDGGGVVRLQQSRVGDGKYVGEKRDVIGRLYKDAEKGDKGAKRKLDSLWSLVIPHLRESKEPFHIYACPKCGQAVEVGEDICVSCGWDKHSSGYSRFGDLGRRR